MEPGLTSAAGEAICKHMNDDHADAIAAYARTFAKLPDVVGARMLAIDSEGMDLAVEVGGDRVTTRIAFDHVLVDPGDARETLIEMARRSMGAGEPPASTAS
jgi:putative heme iron utilization protein